MMEELQNIVTTEEFSTHIQNVKNLEKRLESQISTLKKNLETTLGTMTGFFGKTENKDKDKFSGLTTSNTPFAFTGEVFNNTADGHYGFTSQDQKNSNFNFNEKRSHSSLKHYDGNGSGIRERVSEKRVRIEGGDGREGDSQATPRGLRVGRDGEIKGDKRGVAGFDDGLEFREAIKQKLKKDWDIVLGEKGGRKEDD
jgi:hypothetical protein